MTGILIELETPSHVEGKKRQIMDYSSDWKQDWTQMMKQAVVPQHSTAWWGVVGGETLSWIKRLWYLSSSVCDGLQLAVPRQELEYQ